MQRTVADLIAAGLIAAAAGCGGSAFVAGTEEAGTPSNVTADEACGDDAHARCARIAACSPADIETTYGTEGTCETRLKLNCVDSLAAPDTGNTPALEEGCAIAYTSLDCAEVLNEQPPQACLMAKGPRVNGDACGFPGQCASSFCAIVPGSTCGVCANLPQASDSCAELTTCGQTLFCDANTSLCTGYAPMGSTCNKGQPCGAGLFCVGSTATASGSCQPAVESSGAPCDPAGKTGAGCDKNASPTPLTCSGTTSQCVTLPIVGAGDACGTVAKVTVDCAAGGTCTAVDAGVTVGNVLDAGIAAATSEVCVAAAADLAGCDLVHGPFCVNPARCVLGATGGTSGTCQFQASNACP